MSHIFGPAHAPVAVVGSAILATSSPAAPARPENSVTAISAHVKRVAPDRGDRMIRMRGENPKARDAQEDTQDGVNGRGLLLRVPSRSPRGNTYVLLIQCRCARPDFGGGR